MKMKDSERLAEEFLIMQDGLIPEAIYLAEDLPEGNFRDEVINYLEAKLPMTEEERDSRQAEYDEANPSLQEPWWNAP